MEVYLCSTIRHLLFSLLKSLSQPDKKQIIFMICDQQNIDENSFDKTKLAEHVKVIFIKRETIRNELYSDLQGQCIKLLANFNIQLTVNLQQKIAIKLFNQTLGLSLSKTQLTTSQLFVFNDRNKMSRLFRLAFPTYILIEEGLANYGGIKLKKIEKIISFFSFNKRKMRYFGDDKRCKSIYLITPEKSPLAIRSKVHEINFIEANNINKYCLPFFKILKSKSYYCILATQPLEHTGIDMQIYQKIINVCLKNDISIAIKPHPKEDIRRYQYLLPNIPLIESKVPLELIIFGSSQKTHLISLYSTVGVGFEKYCERHTIIKDNELERIQELTTKWKQDIDLVDKRISKLIDTIRHE